MDGAIKERQGILKKEFYYFSPLVTRLKDGKCWFLYNWLNTENAQVKDSRHPLYKALEKRAPGIEKFSLSGKGIGDFQYLLEKKYIIQNYHEIEQIVFKKYLKWTNPTKLNLILMPVNQACNLNCVYCYEEHSQKEKMGESEKTILEKFIRQKELKSISIDYFGGEPLLNTEFILEFNHSILKIAQERKFTFHSGMTTNGYLLNLPLFESLLKAGVTHYQITLDGIPEDHNKLRPHIDGSGSFETIYSNLKAISLMKKNQYFQIGIRINFNDKSAKKSKRLKFIDKLREDFGDDKRFIVFTKAIGNWNKERKIKKGIYCSDSQAQKMENDYHQDLLQSGFGHGAMLSYRGFGSYACYAGRPNSMIIYPFSPNQICRGLKVQKCTVALKNPFNNVGYINYDGRFVPNSNWDLWVSNSPYKSSKCKYCHFVINCFGTSCPMSDISHRQVECPEKKFYKKEIVKSILDYIKGYKDRRKL